MKDPLEQTIILSIACIVAIVFIVAITALALRNPWASTASNSGQAYGKLTSESREDSCKDTDEKNFQTEGQVRGYKDGRFYTNKDICINDLIVKENFCTGDTAEYVYGNCQALYGQNCRSGMCG